MDKDSTVVEIGGLSGNISRYAYDSFGTKNIYAIEALPDNYAVLVENSKGTPVTPVNLAIGEVDGLMSFSVHPNASSCGFSKYLNKADKQEQQIDVPSQTLDSFMRRYEIENIDFLIMNCEGAEDSILQQIVDSQDLVSKIETISIEMHPQLLGRAHVFKLIGLMNAFYDYRIISRIKCYGPVNVVFTRSSAFTSRIPFYNCRLILAILVGSAFFSLRGIKHKFF